MKWKEDDYVSFDHWVRNEPEGVLILAPAVLAIVVGVVYAVICIIGR